MEPKTHVACGFLEGTILSVAGGYRVLQHPRPDRVFDRIADARWFLAVSFCDHCPHPAAILNHEGQLAFQNSGVMNLGETAFLPLEHRKAVFETCRTLSSGEGTEYIFESNRTLQVWSLEIDPRYGRVAIVQAPEK
ncbi:MAG: hypothetical protein AAGG02_20390 [Cyanobacteria bacterium P01_H01_bin.15]